MYVDEAIKNRRIPPLFWEFSHLVIFRKFPHNTVQYHRKPSFSRAVDDPPYFFQEDGPMELLKERIRREGKVLPGNIIKVDGFLNHRVDTGLLEALADEFAKYFDVGKITMVLTAEASGIALATICARKYGVPMLFAKKAKSDNIEGGLYQSEVFSYTYKKKVTMIVSHEWLHADDRVLIIDDFMAKGYAMQGLIDLVRAAGATLVGIGVAVEKGFQGGGDKLRASGVPYKALAVIEQADENGIRFREDD